MRHLFFFLCIAVFVVLFFCPPLVAAAPPAPLLLRLELSFDLARHALAGEARLLLPAGRDLTLSCAGLDRVRVAVDGVPLPPAEVHTISGDARERQISISYTLEGNTGDRLIAPNGVTLPQGWHPRAEQPFFIALAARLPAGFTAVSALPPQRTEDRNGVRTAHFLLPPQLQPAAFIAGPYVTVTNKIADGPTVSGYFFPEDQGLAQNYVNRAADYLARYAALFGPYPHEHYAVVANRLPSGYALPGLTLLGQSVLRLPFIVESSLAHEVLHAWFGIGVRPRDGDWSEGLVAHLADHALAEDRLEGLAHRRRILADHASHVPRDNGMRLADFQGAMDRLPEAKTVRAIGYGRGVFLFHMLEKKIGAAAFRQALRSFFAERQGDAAGWDDLRRACEKSSGQNLAGFFGQWLQTPHIPELAIDNVQVREEEGQVLLRFQLKQAREPFLRLELPVLIQTAAGRIEKVLSMEKGVREVEIPLDDRPESLVIDPRLDVLRELADEELPPVFSFFLGHGEKYLVLPPAKLPQPDARLVAAFGERGLPVIREDALTEEHLRRASLLFTDPAARTLTGLVGPVKPEAGPLWLEVWKNPLAARRVLGVVTATADPALSALLARLFHHGGSSVVAFGADGRMRRETKTASAGISTIIETQTLAIPAAAPVSFKVLAEKLAAVRVAHVGETHTAMGDHRLQLAVIRAMHRQDPNLAIGMEMFPRASQQTLDDYVGGRMGERAFLKKSGYFRHWAFDFRLYRDILRFARRYQIPVIGLNLEKELVAKVFRQGAIALDAGDKARLPAERDLGLPGYRERLAGVYRQHPRHPEASGQTGFAGFLQSQALWDESMAETAATYLSAHPGRRMVLVAGRGHTDKENAIPPRLARRLGPALRQMVLAATGGEQDFDGRGADFYVETALVELPPLPLLGVFLEEPAAGKKGARIERLAAEGAAAKAGLKAQDLILTLDGEAVADPEDIKILMLEKEGRDSVTLGLLRHANDIDTELTLTVSLKKEAADHP